MKLFNAIKNWFIEVYVSFNMIEYKYLIIQKNKKLHKYIEKIALELSESENIKVFNVSFDEMNKNETEECHKAVGRFYYISKENLLSYNDKLKQLLSLDINYENRNKYFVPRIEITELGGVFTLIHELGHYFIYKRDQEQSEPAADMYVEEFFNEYLPPFFKWIFQIDIFVRTDKKINFSNIECYNYLKEYKRWIKNNPEYFE